MTHDLCQCGSLQCQECALRTQETFVNEAVRVFKGYPDLYLLSLVPKDGLVSWPPDDSLDLNRFTKRQRERISSCIGSDALVLGAVDFSLNIEETGEQQLGAHVHCITSRKLRSSELEALKRVFPRSKLELIYKPVMQKPICKGDLRSVGEYCCKTSHTKRSSFIAVPKSDRNPYRDGRDQALSAKEDAQLRRYLGKYGVCDPIISIGLKRVRTSDPAEVRLMPARKR